MSLRRCSSPSGRRALVAAGLTAAIVAVPAGTAAAAPADPTPPDAAIEFLMSGANGQLTPESLFALPAIAIPQELREVFQMLADAAMLPENCVDGVADAIELILNGVVALPLELADALTGLLELLLGLGEELPGLPGLEELQGLLDGLLGGLLGGLPGSTPPVADAPAADAAAVAAPADAGGTPPATPEEEVLEDGAAELPTVVAGLAALGEALVGCLPIGAEEPPAATPAPTTPPVAAPTEEPPAVTPAPHTPAPAAAPVAYLGYAPTGADAARADDASAPLTAVAAGLVLLAGAGAAGYGLRGRAVRARD